ncbi:MAG: NAD(P)H-hydrate dehydratase [Clostridia bacterium]|nr:NAD(P)H-hydrate dehydratase [Clostridia bacterium]
MIIATDVNTMRHSDAMTIKNSIPSRELVRRGGEAVFRSYGKWNKTAVVCGTGNNGADGYVLALSIAASGKDAKIFLLEEKFSADGAYYFDLCKKAGIPYEIYRENTDFSEFDTVADCIFGTGFRGTVEGRAAKCIEDINRTSKFTVSADINSGLCGDSGRVCGVCVSSDLTVSVGFYKPGHFLCDAKDNIKKLTNVDIEIALYGDAVYIPESGDFSEILPVRTQNTHKGNYGYVAVLGGCREYLGAAKLANLSMSALRCGCGVAKLAVPKSLCDFVAPHILESTLFPMPDNDGKMIFDKNSLDALCKNTRAVACGMGWGSSVEYEKILSYLFENYSGTLIIDADGLNTLAQMDKSILAECRPQGVILTPHVMEFSRLSGLSCDEILKDPVGCAKKYAARFCGKVTLLLKGRATVITDGNTTYITDRGCAGMATAGSGDVLSGILSGIMGYNFPSVKAVACGAFIAGAAGELAGKEMGDISMTSSDTVRYLPWAVKIARGCENDKTENVLIDDMANCQP